MAEAWTFPDTGPTKHLLSSLRRAEATGAGDPLLTEWPFKEEIVNERIARVEAGRGQHCWSGKRRRCRRRNGWNQYLHRFGMLGLSAHLSQPGRGGAGGGWGGGDGSSDPRDEYHKISWCTDAPSYAWHGQGCDLYNPPVLSVNGCGTAGGVPVPDFLVAPGALQGGAAAFGAMFKAACDAHDMCYGTHGNDKHQCDERLREDMIADGQQKLGGAFPAFGVFVIGQATAYARFLQWEWIEPWTSQPAYDQSQMDAACRTSSAAFKNYCDHLGFGS